MKDELGCGVFVQGQMIAWFRDFNEEAQEWCSENYFGEWLTWPCYEPKMYELTAEEQAAVHKRAKEFAEIIWVDTILENIQD